MITLLALLLRGGTCDGDSRRCRSSGILGHHRWLINSSRQIRDEKRLWMVTLAAKHFLVSPLPILMATWVPSPEYLPERLPAYLLPLFKTRQPALH